MQHHRSGHNTHIHFTHTHTYIYILEVLIGQNLEKYHFNGPNQAHLQAFIYLSCIVAYTLTIFILTGVFWGEFSYGFVYLCCVHQPSPHVRVAVCLVPPYVYPILHFKAAIVIFYSLGLYIFVCVLVNKYDFYSQT